MPRLSTKRGDCDVALRELLLGLEIFDERGWLKDWPAIKQLWDKYRIAKEACEFGKKK